MAKKPMIWQGICEIPSPDRWKNNEIAKAMGSIQTDFSIKDGLKVNYYHIIVMIPNT